MSTRAWRGVLVAVIAVGLVEMARRLGVSLPDMTALYLLAVVYAALDGGLWTGLASVFVTFGHALVTAGGGAPGMSALAVVAPATVAVATLLRGTVTHEDADEPRAATHVDEDASGPPMTGGDTVEIEREPGTLAFSAMSDNAEQVLGVPAEHALANAELWTSGLHPGDRTRVQAAYEALKKSPEQCTMTYRVLSIDAGFIAVRETLTPHRALPGGRVLKLVGAITRVPDADAPTASVADAPATDAAIPAAATSAAMQKSPAPPGAAASPSDSTVGDEALSKVASEVGESLDVLTGWARVLRGQPDASTRARAADMIERVAAMQARVVEPLVGGGGPRPRLVDMALVVHTALELMRPAVQARSVSVGWSVDPALDLLYGDAERLQQIVRTMLANAIELAPDGARIHAAIEQAGSLARLTVRDTAEHGASFFVTLPVTTSAQSESATA
jgi:hypothetical protein